MSRHSYILVSSEHEYELVEKVRQATKDGYVPQGGPFVHTAPSSEPKAKMYQAMVASPYVLTISSCLDDLTKIQLSEQTGSVISAGSILQNQIDSRAQQ